MLASSGSSGKTKSATMDCSKAPREQEEHEQEISSQPTEDGARMTNVGRMKCSNKINKVIMPYSLIPTLNTFNMPNAFGLLATGNDDAQDYNDDATIQCSNLSSSPG